MSIKIEAIERTSLVLPGTPSYFCTFEVQKSAFSPLTNSPLPTPLSAVSSQFTNEYHSSLDNSINESPTTIVESGRCDHEFEDDIDDDQWAGWDEDPILSEPSPEISSASTMKERITSKVVRSSNKSLKLNNISKSKWYPNAPFGSEYEIPPVILKSRS